MNELQQKLSKRRTYVEDAVLRFGACDCVRPSHIFAPSSVVIINRTRRTMQNTHQQFQLCIDGLRKAGDAPGHKIVVAVCVCVFVVVVVVVVVVVGTCMTLAVSLNGLGVTSPCRLMKMVAWRCCIIETKW